MGEATSGPVRLSFTPALNMPKRMKGLSDEVIRLVQRRDGPRSRSILGIPAKGGDISIDQQHRSRVP